MASEHPWSNSSPIPGAQDDGQDPALAATAGAIHAVWISNKTLYHARLVAGQWQEPTRFASGEQPALAAAPDGSIHCAFAHWFLGNCEIYTTRWDGAGWSLPLLISYTSGVSTHPAICVTREGGVHIAWADTTPGYSTIYHAWPERGSWANAPIPNGQGSRPTIAAAPTGEIYMAWQDRLSETGCFQVLAATKRDGAWSVPELVSDDPSHHAISPSLAINPQGACHLIWQEERSGIYGIRYAERQPGGWSLPVDISRPGGDARLPRIAAAPKGFFQALWVETAALRHRARPSEYNAAWSGEETACANSSGVSGLAAVVSPATGELHLLWSVYADSDQRRLYHAYRKPLMRHTVFIPIATGPG